MIGDGEPKGIVRRRSGARGFACALAARCLVACLLLAAGCDFSFGAPPVAGDAQDDPLTRARLAFDALSAYRVTLRSGGEGGADTAAEIIRYTFQKPGFVRMEFVRPHPGAVLIYDPGARKATLRPFAGLTSMSLRLSPGNRLIRSAKGHRIDESDLGELLLHAAALRDLGGLTVNGPHRLAGRDTVRFEVAAPAGQAVRGVRRFEVWLDPASFLPVAVKSYAPDGVLIESLVLDGLEVDPKLPADCFRR